MARAMRLPSVMALYAVRSEVVPNPPRTEEAKRRHGEHVGAMLRSAGLAARWMEVRTTWSHPGVVDVIEAPDEATARAAADLIALTHASIEEAA